MSLLKNLRIQGEYIDDGKYKNMCSICQMPMWNAISWCDNSHESCEGCFNRCNIQSNSRCYMCRGTINVRKLRKETEDAQKYEYTCPNRNTMNMFNQFRYIITFCKSITHLDPNDITVKNYASIDINSLKGIVNDKNNDFCYFKGNQDELQKHYWECPYRMTCCCWCNFCLPIKHLSAHLEECPEYPMWCHFCNDNVPRGILTQHLEKCGIKCKRCGSWVSKKDKLKQKLHSSQCKMFKCHVCHYYVHLSQLEMHLFQHETNLRTIIEENI